MERYVQIATTTPRRDVARQIARALVELRLAACVQIVGPIESTYRWEGAVETAREWLCLVKTTRARLRAASAAIADLHTYENPEIAALPIITGSRRYLDWLAAAVRPTTGKSEPPGNPHVTERSHIRSSRR